MLKVIKPEAFYEGSFADQRITKAETEFDTKYLKFYIEGALTEDQDENRLVFSELEMEIFNWSNMLLKMQVSEEKMPVKMTMKVISNDEFDVLDDIVLYRLDERSLTIEGFGRKTSLWCIYQFIDPEIVIKGELVSP